MESSISYNPDDYLVMILDKTSYINIITAIYNKLRELDSSFIKISNNKKHNKEINNIRLYYGISENNNECIKLDATYKSIRYTKLITAYKFFIDITYPTANIYVNKYDIPYISKVNNVIGIINAEVLNNIKTPLLYFESEARTTKRLEYKSKNTICINLDYINTPVNTCTKSYFTIDCKSKKLFEGIIFDRLRGVQRPIDELSPIIQKSCEYINTLDIDNNIFKKHLLISKFQECESTLYQSLMYYITNFICTIHTSKYEKFAICNNHNEFLIFLNRLIDGTINIKNIKNDDIVINFGEKIESHKVSVDKSNKFKLLNTTPNLFRCPCLHDSNNEYITCGYVFNILSSESVNFLDSLLQNPKLCNLLENPIIYNKFNDSILLLQVIAKNEVLNRDRCYPMCPKCNTVFKNIEGIKSESIINCINIHPSQVTCIECNYLFCTDCKKSHPGILCRGDTDAPARCCPGCKGAIHKVEGCQFIHCENIYDVVINNITIKKTCNLNWCYTCRLPRCPEGINSNHYCPIKEYYKSNPTWVNNKEFTPLDQIKD